MQKVPTELVAGSAVIMGSALIIGWVSLAMSHFDSIWFPIIIAVPFALVVLVTVIWHILWTIADAWKTWQRSRVIKDTDNRRRGAYR